VPPTSEASPSSKVLGVKGVDTEGWLDAGSVLAAKATNVTTKITSVTTKAADMATKASSEPSPGMARCHRRWSERQTQRNRRR
jgi:hypothetical protein